MGTNEKTVPPTWKVGHFVRLLRSRRSASFSVYGWRDPLSFPFLFIACLRWRGDMDDPYYRYRDAAWPACANSAHLFSDVRNCLIFVVSAWDVGRATISQKIFGKLKGANDHENSCITVVPNEYGAS